MKSMEVCRFYNVELSMGKKVCLLCVVEEGRDVGEVGSGGRDLLSAPGRREPGEGGGGGGGGGEEGGGYLCFI